MASIERMRAKDLHKWVMNLERALKTEPKGSKNYLLYDKWLKEARAEQEARLHRKNDYLRRHT